MLNSFNKDSIVNTLDSDGAKIKLAEIGELDYHKDAKGLIDFKKVEQDRYFDYKRRQEKINNRREQKDQEYGVINKLLLMYLTT